MPTYTVIYRENGTKHGPMKITELIEDAFFEEEEQELIQLLRKSEILTLDDSTIIERVE